MKDDRYWLQAYEYVFSLGCKIPLIANEQLPSESICYQSLRIPTFDPSYLISILQVGQMAELEFCALKGCGRSIEETNASYRWINSLADVFEAGSIAPSALPPHLCFVQGRGEFTSGQINWLEAEMEQLQPLTLQTENRPEMTYERDGEVSSGSIKINGQPVHRFYLLNQATKDALQSQFHRALYKLAASVITDPECVRVLKNMRLNTVYPSRTPIENFTFPLIE